jgi:prophage maintenance system killer protein
VDEPVWIKDEVVLAIHQRQLAEHGGSGGVRDEGLLASALARTKNLLVCSEKKAAIDKEGRLLMRKALSRIHWTSNGTSLPLRYRSFRIRAAMGGAGCP